MTEGGKGGGVGLGKVANSRAGYNIVRWSGVGQDRIGRDGTERYYMEPKVFSV
jgi:hypothetical protein